MIRTSGRIEKEKHTILSITTMEQYDYYDEIASSTIGQKRSIAQAYNLMGGVSEIYESRMGDYYESEDEHLREYAKKMCAVLQNVKIGITQVRKIDLLIEHYCALKKQMEQLDMQTKCVQAQLERAKAELEHQYNARPF